MPGDRSADEARIACGAGGEDPVFEVIEGGVVVTAVVEAI
jgi:hypothetical protein